MKTKTIFQKTTVIFALFVFTIFAFNSCSKDDDDGPDMSSIFDKWWRATNDPIDETFDFISNSDIYFDSNGEYVQREPDTGELNSPGNWLWEDKSNGIMKIDYDEDTSQILSSAWYKFSDIEDNTMTVQPSVDGLIYFVEYYWQNDDN